MGSDFFAFRFMESSMFLSDLLMAPEPVRTVAQASRRAFVWAVGRCRNSPHGVMAATPRGEQPGRAVLRS